MFNHKKKNAHISISKNAIFFLSACPTDHNTMIYLQVPGTGHISGLHMLTTQGECSSAQPHRGHEMSCNSCIIENSASSGQYLICQCLIYFNMLFLYQKSSCKHFPSSFLALVCRDLVVFMGTYSSYALSLYYSPTILFWILFIWNLSFCQSYL